MEEPELEPCPFCGCKAIYEVDRTDDLVGHYPQLFCNGCKLIIEVENDSTYLDDTSIYNYLRNKLINTWNRREKDA